MSLENEQDNKDKQDKLTKQNNQDNKDTPVRQDMQAIGGLKFLRGENSRFHRGEDGFLRLDFADTCHERVKLHRVLPYRHPDGYISVSGTDGAEIGMIRSLDDFDREQADLLRAELARRYFCPEILTIRSLKEKMGYVYFTVNTNSGEKDFAVRDVSNSIRMLDDRRLLIVDADGNRYAVPDMDRLDAASRKKLEPYLF